MQKPTILSACIIAAVLATAASAHAQVFAQENFGGYNTGVDVLSQGTAGNGWANVWADKNALDVVEPGNLTYTDGLGNTLATSGNSLYSTGTTLNSNSAEPQRTLTTTLGVSALANTADPNTVWMSYIWLGGNTSATGSAFRQATMMFLKGASPTSTSPGGTEYMDVGMPNITAGGLNPDISLWDSAGNAGQSLSSTAPLQSTVLGNTGTSDFMLIEFTGTAANWGTVGGTETMNVWINPTLTGSAPVGTPDLSYGLQDLSVLNAIRVQGGGNNATYGGFGSETVSDIVFGDTPSDVETLQASPTPEPATMALAALGGLGLFAIRRKR